MSDDLLTPIRESSDAPADPGDTRRPDDALEPSVLSPDPARERRVKALTCTEPLHSLQSNRGRRGWDAFDFYDLGLAAIDTVVDRMGFDTGVSREELDAIILGEIRRVAPDMTDRDREPVVTELVETLIRPNIGEYTSALDEVRRRFDFALLTEHEHADGSIYLRATNEAINVLVGGLNTDIESAQVAAEATLEHLIRRRRLDDAARPAREAKIRSIQYATFVRQVIDETKRDIRRAGWREDVPARLAEIREHLHDRMQTEQRLLAAMQETRDSASRDDLRRQAAALVETVDDCFARHQEVHTIVMSAVRVYVDEQDRQVFGQAAAIGVIDLTEELLLPALGAPIREVGVPLARLAERLLGFAPGPRSASVTPRQPRLGLFVLALLRPPAPRDPFGAGIDEPEWESAPVDPFAFTAEAWAGADTLLEALDPPVRLSALLETAERIHGFEVADLVRLRALVATSPDLDAIRPRARPVVAAVDDGARFQSRWFLGADLLVGSLTADEDAYAAIVLGRGESSDAAHREVLPPVPQVLPGLSGE